MLTKDCECIQMIEHISNSLFRLAADILNGKGVIVSYWYPGQCRYHDTQSWLHLIGKLGNLSSDPPGYRIEFYDAKSGSLDFARYLNVDQSLMLIQNALDLLIWAMDID